MVSEMRVVGGGIRRVNIEDETFVSSLAPPPHLRHYLPGSVLSFLRVLLLHRLPVVGTAAVASAAVPFLPLLHRSFFGGSSLFFVVRILDRFLSFTRRSWWGISAAADFNRALDVGVLEDNAGLFHFKYFVVANRDEEAFGFF